MRKLKPKPESPDQKFLAGCTIGAYVFLMALVFVLAILLSATSCTPVRETIRPALERETFYRDTVLVWFVPGEHQTDTFYVYKWQHDTIYKSDTIHRIDTVFSPGIELPYTSHLLTGICESKVEIDTQFKVTHDVWQRSVEEEVEVTDAVQHTTEYVTLPPIVTNELTTWQQVRIWAGNILIILFFGFVGYRIFSRTALP